MAVTSSDLKTQVTFEAQTSAPDAYNASVPTWATLLTCWAAVVPLKGALLSVAGAHTMVATNSYTVTVRYNAQLRYSNRIKIPAYTDSTGTRPERVLTITAGPLDLNESHSMMQFTCTELPS